MKTINPKMLVMLFALLFLAACDNDADDDDYTDPMPEETAAVYNDEAVRTEIQGLETAYADAFNRKDADGAMAYYSEDAESYSPDEPALVGRDAIKESIRKEIESNTSSGKLNFTVKDVWSAADIAVETGTWSYADSAGNQINSGKFMTLFQKRDGKYVAIRDIHNADKPWPQSQN